MKKVLTILLVAFIGAVCASWAANAADSAPQPGIHSSADGASAKAKTNKAGKKHKKKHKKKKKQDKN